VTIETLRSLLRCLLCPLWRMNLPFQFGGPYGSKGHLADRHRPLEESELCQVIRQPLKRRQTRLVTLGRLVIDHLPMKGLIMRRITLVGVELINRPQSLPKWVGPISR